MSISTFSVDFSNMGMRSSFYRDFVSTLRDTISYNCRNICWQGQFDGEEQDWSNNVFQQVAIDTQDTRNPNMR
jgi:hypothetical protein